MNDSLTPAEYHALATKQRPRKYRNTPTVVDETRFDSKKESQYYLLLKERERLGEIEDLVLQPRYPIEIAGIKVCVVVPDFKYRCRVTGDVYVLDIKSPATRKNRAYVIKKKLLRAVYGIEIVEI
jgi:hypothetical protein